VAYSTPLETWTMVVGRAVAAFVVTTGGGVVCVGVGEGITGWVHPERARRQRRRPAVATRRARSVVRPGNLPRYEGIQGDWLTGF
jgi:hypothetical protein